MDEHQVQAETQVGGITAASDGERSKSFSRRRLAHGVLGGLAALVAGVLARPKQTEAVAGTWDLNGNAGTTDTGTEFVGTLDNVPLLFKTAGVERMRIGRLGRVGIGCIPAVQFDVVSHDPYAIQGESTSTLSDSASIHGEGTSATNGAGVLGTSDHTITNSFGVRGTHSGAGRGVDGTSTSTTGIGVGGSGKTGVHGFSGLTDGTGVFGSAGAGTDSKGVHGISGNGHAGYFDGDVHVTDTLTKGGGAFRIDHPMDPANRYLSHSFVESPDMKNVYDGVAVLDGDGSATVQMPDWFETLNADFRYQLTCIGTFAPVYIEREIKQGSFRIAGGVAGQRVSWQITGTRQDAFARAHRVVVEMDKPKDKRGTYLHPVELGRPLAEGMRYRELARAGLLSEA